MEHQDQILMLYNASELDLGELRALLKTASSGAMSFHRQDIFAAPRCDFADHMATALLTNGCGSQQGVLFWVSRKLCDIGFKAKRVVRACVGFGGRGQGAVHCLVSQGSKGSVVEQRIEIGTVSRVIETISPVLLSAFASRCPCLRGARIA
jgi:hypothetical protein